MNFDQAKPSPSIQLPKEKSCLPSCYEGRYSNIDRLYQGESRNRSSHKTMQQFPSTSASSSFQENIFVKSQSEDINLNLRPTYSSSVDITSWKENQQTHIKEPVCSKTSELFEHTYARPSHEENDFERRLKRWKIESNLENISPVQQDYSNFKLKKSLPKESSCQPAADSSLILSESNGSFPCAKTYSDVEELFEHTYARPSHEENDFERRLERLKIESNLENVQQNYSYIKLNKSLLKESSRQAAADSSLRFSESNGLFPCTYKASSDSDELFEHTYARPLHEENDSEMRLQRLKIESSLEGVCPIRKNDFNIILNKSLPKESSFQAAADSSLILSESTGSFPYTKASSDADELFEHTYARLWHEENHSKIRLERLKIESTLENVCPFRQNNFNSKLDKSLPKESSCQAAADLSLILSESNGSFPCIKTSDSDELFEHSYARPSREENDSEIRLESMKAENNIENICSLQQNDFNIDLNKSLLKESSCQVATDSVLRLSEGNDSFHCTSETSSDSDADLFLNFVDSTFEEYSNACFIQNNLTNFMQSEGSSSISLNEDAEEELQLLLGQQEPCNNLHQTVSNTFSEPFEILQTLNETRPTSVTEVAPLENSQSTSFDITNTRASNNYDVLRTTEEQSNQVALMRNLINSIVELFALSPLGQIFEAARISTAEVEDADLLTNFYNVLLEIMVAAQTHNPIQPSCSRLLKEAEDNQNRNKNYPKTKKMTIPNIMNGKKMKSWKNAIIKRYLNNGSLPPDPVPYNELQMNTVTCTIFGGNVQPCANESRMILRPRNTVCYQEDSDSNISPTKKSIRTISKKINPTGKVHRKKLVLKKLGINCKNTIQTILSGEENCSDKCFSGTSSIDIRNAITSSAVVEEVSDINHNIIWSTDSIDRTMGEARNRRPNILSALMNFKHDYFLFRRLVMRDFNIQAQSEKRSRKKKVNNFNIKKVNRRSIKLKVSRFFNGFYSLPSNITKPDASGKWTYQVSQINTNTTI